MHRLRALGSIALVTCGLASTPAHAQTAPKVEPVSAEKRAHAEEEFKHAKALYQEGRYPEARAALLEARKLDPNAKDLVFNLGVVAEKQLEYDEAITYLREYKAMDSVTEVEAQRADASIKRIEGARAGRPKPNEPAVVAPVAPPAPLEPPRHGRVDALTVAGLGLTGAAVATGAVFGALALSANPAASVETGKQNPFSRVQSDHDHARKYGLVADVGFGVAIVAAIGTGILYFTRTKEPARRTGLVVHAHGVGLSF